MAELATTTTSAAALSVTGGFVFWLGPHLGPWVAVLLASIIGSLWTVGNVQTQSRTIAWFVLIRLVMTSMLLTGAFCFALSDYISKYIPDEFQAIVVAFMFSMFGDRLKEFKDVAFERLKGMISK